MTHPNHEHLLKVLNQTRSEIMAGRGFGESSGPSESSSPSEMSPESDQSQSWASERQDAFPTTSTSSMDKFDENTLLTDDQVDRQSQESLSSNFQTDLASFTPRDRPSQDSLDNPRSAWDNLRARAAQSKPPQEKPKEQDIWGNDK